MLPKILVGCPTYYKKGYCLDQYVSRIKSLSYPNYDILLVDNSIDMNYFKRIKALGIPVIKDSPKSKPHDTIVHSRNLIKQHALDKGYDYFLSLEQDVVPPKNVIERLLGHDKKVVSAVYYTFYKFHGIPKLRPLVWADVAGQPDKMRFMGSECNLARNSLQPVVCRVKMCGLGCVLVHRSVLEKVSFRVPFDYSTYDDFAFCDDVRKIGEDVWADLSVQCEHFVEKE